MKGGSYLHNPVSSDYTQYFIVCAEDEGGLLFLESVCFGRSKLKSCMENALSKYPIVMASKMIKRIDKIADAWNEEIRNDKK